MESNPYDYTLDLQYKQTDIWRREFQTIGVLGLILEATENLIKLTQRRPNEHREGEGE